MSDHLPDHEASTSDNAQHPHGRRRAGRRRRFAVAASVPALVVALVTVLGVGATASAQVEHDSCSGTPAVSNSTTNTGLIADCDILLAAKPILIGDKTQATLNWSPDVAMFGWDGITIDRTFGHVADISLSSNDSVSANDLSGSIPPELGNLTGLETLSLSGNALSGSIPPSLGNLTNLVYFNLSDNELSGSIPPELDNLTKLEAFGLSGNDLSGCIPLGLTRVLAEQSLGLSACCLGSGGGLDVGVATVVVANGWSPSDVGAASVLAARTASAVVTYTEGDELSSELEVLLGELSPGEVIIVGGTAAVMSDVCSQVRLALPESDIFRVTGADRADTAARVARRILGNASETRAVTLIVANGWSPPDIGVAAALAAATENAAVAYTQREMLPEATAALIRDYRPTKIIIIGGSAAVTDTAFTAIAGSAPHSAEIRRITGQTRIHTAIEAARQILARS